MKTLAEQLDLENNTVYQTANNVVDTILNVTDEIFDGVLRGILPNSIEDKVINIKNALDLKGLSGKVADITQEIFYGNGNVSDYCKTFEIEKRTEIIAENVKELFGSKSKEKSKVDEKKDEITQKLEEELTNSVKKYVNTLEKNEEYIKSWKEFYENKDLKNMEKIYKKIEKNKEKLLPIENELKKIKEIENITTLIKSKGGDFDLTKEELELSQKLT